MHLYFIKVGTGGCCLHLWSPCTLWRPVLPFLTLPCRAGLPPPALPLALAFAWRTACVPQSLAPGHPALPAPGKASHSRSQSVLGSSATKATCSITNIIFEMKKKKKSVFCISNSRPYNQVQEGRDYTMKAIGSTLAGMKKIVC